MKASPRTPRNRRRKKAPYTPACPSTPGSQSVSDNSEARAAQRKNADPAMRADLGAQAIRQTRSIPHFPVNQHQYKQITQSVKGNTGNQFHRWTQTSHLLDTLRKKVTSQPQATQVATNLSPSANIQAQSQCYKAPFNHLNSQKAMTANHLIHKVGPAPQPLRFPGFPSQQAPQNRNTPLGSGRLQNTKIGLHPFSSSNVW